MEEIVYKTFQKICLSFLLVSSLDIFSMEKTDSIDSEELPKKVLDFWFQQRLEKNYEDIKDNPKLAGLYAEQLAEYQKYEANIESLSNNPLASVMGGMNYAMSFDEMKERIKQKFIAMKKAGLIISSEEFAKVKDDYYDLKRDNLTRIWCADYVKEKIRTSDNLKDTYDVPDYVIVLNPNQKKIEIIWYLDSLFPLAGEIKGATIYFKAIKGKGAADDRNKRLLDDIGLTSEIGFKDFGDIGNIIKEKETGKYYIVDTELNSFSFPIKGELLKMLDYARYRFKYLNDIVLYERSEIDLSD